MKIGKLRKKLKDKEFLEKQYTLLCCDEDYWEDFYTFECSTTFREEQRVKYNEKLYEKGTKKVSRQKYFIKSLLTSD